MYAENIIRLLLDGVNLNHLSKNHPHVDIAIIKGIKNITKRDEVISVKSSIRDETLSSVISTTKAIKIENILKYIIFASSGFQFNYKDKFRSASALINNTNKKIKESLSTNPETNDDYQAVFNICLYYLLTSFEDNMEGDYIEDFNRDIEIVINSSGTCDYNLTYDMYSDYKYVIKNKIKELKIPISLGCIYKQPIIELEEGINNLTCVIKKTNPILLSDYWENILNLWPNSNHQYLKLEEVKSLFRIKTDNFPIEIRISIGRYRPDEFIEDELSSVISNGKKRTKELYIATKFKDTDFGKYSDEVNNYFLKTINTLRVRPYLVTKFIEYSKSIKSTGPIRKS